MRTIDFWVIAKSLVLVCYKYVIFKIIVNFEFFWCGAAKSAFEWHLKGLEV